MTDPADIYGRAHKESAKILADLLFTGKVTVDAGQDLVLLIQLLAQTEEFTRNAKADVQEAIGRLNGLTPALEPILRQIPEDLEIITRSVTESTGLAKQARGRLTTAEEYLQDLAEQAQAHANVTANVATLMKGREYLMTNRTVLARAIRLAGVKVVREILAEIEATETRPLE